MRAFFVNRAANAAVNGRNDPGDNFCHFMTLIDTKEDATGPVDYVQAKL